MTTNTDSEKSAMQKCFSCGNTDEHVALLSCRKQGQSLWVCTRCLPMLIHG